jgi:uncharacterized membrane protein (UPF0127 family)
MSVCLLAGVGCSTTSTPAPVETAALRSGVLRIATAAGSAELRVRIAETAKAREHGLMGVRRLDPDQGMAFVFPEPTTSAFWMKDTLIPLSIAFWGPGGRVLSVQEMLPCLADPCPLYSPGQPFVGAVEAPKGFFTDVDAQPGDRVVLDRTG